MSSRSLPTVCRRVSVRTSTRAAGSSRGLRVRAAMNPIATVPRALRTGDSVAETPCNVTSYLDNLAFG